MPEGRDPQRPGVRHLEVEDADGQRIDNYLVRMLKGVPRSRIYRMLRRGEVRINSRRARPEDRVTTGDRIRVPPVVIDSGGVTPASNAFLRGLESRLLHVDEDVIVLDKPSGLAVHGGGGVRHGAIEGLRQLFPDDRLELAHRIDRDTSGILLVARRRPVLLALHAAFREGRVAKRYEALVHGRWPRRLRTVQSALERYVTSAGERRVRIDAEAGKTSRTDFELIAADAAASRLAVFPHTGRTHQIRVHCRQAGHPIVGDEKYSNDAQLAVARSAGVHRLCLHARSIRLELDARTLRFEAPVPEDFEQAWMAIRGSG